MRAAQNRATDGGAPLFDLPADWPVLQRYLVHVPASKPGTRARDAQVSLRAGAMVQTAAHLMPTATHDM